MRKILIDTGMGGRDGCRVAGPATVELIGDALCAELEKRGFETLPSCRVPDLNPGEGRPARCAEIAKEWGADCLLRLYVRAAADPLRGSADAMVFRQRSRAGELAQRLLDALVSETGMTDGGIRSSPGVLLLRRTVCPSVILILRLPFHEKEFPTDAEIRRYAGALADGLEKGTNIR